jgi:protein TonB
MVFPAHNKGMQSEGRLVFASVVLHLVVLTALLYVRPLHVEPARFPGTALGSRISLTYSVGRAPAAAEFAAAKPAPAKLTHSVKASEHAQPLAALSSISPSTANANAAQGGDALGSGNVTVALATFFPWPRLDPSSLPHGTRGDVVVEVVIDEQGRIIHTQVAHSLGEPIDQQVLAAIASWMFKPATKNGVAVPSEQELLFHYERS